MLPTWFFYALAAPMIFALGNYYDKFLLGRFGRRASPTVLIMFTGFFGLCASAVITILHPQALHVPLHDAALVLFAGVFFLVGLIPYIHALSGDEATAVVPLFQMAPVIYLLLGWLILHETLTAEQLIGGGIVMLGAMVLALNGADHFRKLRIRTLLLILLASSFLALGSTLFKFVALEHDYWSANAWEYLGEGIAGITLFLCFPKIRKDTRAVLQKDAPTFFFTNVSNDLLTFCGSIALSFAMLQAPVALVSLVEGFQPFFILIYGFFWSKLFPQYGTETLHGTALLRKIIAVLIMFGGIALLTLS